MNWTQFPRELALKISQGLQHKILFEFDSFSTVITVENELDSISTGVRRLEFGLVASGLGERLHPGREIKSYANCRSRSFFSLQFL